MEKKMRGKKTVPLTPEQEAEVTDIFAAGGTYEEAAAVTGISVSILKRKYKNLHDVGMSKVRWKTRRALLRAIEQGNVAAIIWMSKQREDCGGLAYKEPPREAPPDPTNPVQKLTDEEIQKKIDQYQKALTPKDPNDG